MTGRQWDTDERTPSTGCSCLLFAVAAIVFLIAMAGIAAAGIALSSLVSWD
ncbi:MULTISPECIES: hypothetical protein [Streptomyces]|uniref:Integral membrane protein n=1 Tax=Streptomyces tricolor TaxID=68277 RepID=A0ABS9JJ12_9ACTN|nr:MULTISPECIES: hypothetical protein [Streptomyces]MCG0065555.1 hypothetical protein [Streptomyces tricolor]BCM72938.1 hypothetical protein EASAB2608_08272 [Streptomyces sp. EAS-AB2608]